MRKYLWGFAFILPILAALAVMPALGAEPHGAFAAAKTIKLAVENDYGVDVRPILPIKAIALQWLGYAGVRVVPDDAEAFDAWVRITVNGQALQSDYQDGKTRYTGARLTGEILFAKGDGSRYAEEFTGEEETAFMIAADDSRFEPEKAPFDQALRDEGSYIFKIAEMMGRIYGTGTLVAALQDKDELVRIGAIYPAAGAGNEDYPAPALIAALSDENATVQDLVGQALIKAGERALEPLIALLKSDADGKGKGLEAAKILGAIGKPALDKLSALLGDENAMIRKSAVWGLGEVADPQVIPVLLRMLNDAKPEVRTVAAMSLLKSGKNLLEIDCIRQPDVIQAVIGVLDDSYTWDDDYQTDLAIVEKAEQTLVGIGDAAIPPLLNALKTVSLKDNVMDTLVLMGESDTLMTMLIAALGDKDPGYREEAAETLRRLTGQDFGENAGAWTKWWKGQGKPTAP